VNGKVRGYSPWIPEGTYTVKFTHYETGKSWNDYKVHAHFAVVEGEHAGVPLTRYYNVDAFIGQSGLNGQFEASRGRHLVRELYALLPAQAYSGAANLNAYEGLRITAEVATVGKDGLGHGLAGPNRYSKIKRLIEIMSDDPAKSEEIPKTRVGKGGVG